MRLTILGARGSMAVSGQQYQEFGGATTCFLVEGAGEAIYIDAGTGILSTPDVGDARITLLLTHPHLDHLLGLPFFRYLTENKRKITIYGENRMGLSVEMQIARFLSPPLWPVGLYAYPAEVSCAELAGTLTLGGLTIDSIEGAHPGGCTIYRITEGEKKLVIATDYEHTETKNRELSQFAEGADLILYDAQYTDEEYGSGMAGRGHSTISEGLRIFEQSGAKQIMFVHHDPSHDDQKLRHMESEAISRCPRARLARGNNIIMI